ncbi:hypothetical protein [Phytopseudomonas dryadis]|uniref:Alginate biosynthesis protein AlgF n=1 Tax=Phytopseudomonas dryadis TaxID=2487520 RepID=A0A4Q9R6S8_9GAMM|nr:MULTISPECIES: hypothetical protein [Pseudomonas]TBU95694.1 hypothetical protein DNK44_07180 [Pseudomonas dryadis]TBV06730.1 hypothetical protein DNK34_10370 [Pseudomonas dryadis]TBV18565.1 hypothetical protein DNK41_07670 [Pseudomonas sp. FRB 230]
MFRYPRCKVTATAGLALLGAVLLSLAPSAGAQDVLERFGERPYTGRVDFHVAPPSGKPSTLYGRGSVHLVRTEPGKATLQLQGKVPDTASQTDLNVSGRYDADGWRSDPGDVQIRIDADGRISGGGASAGRTFHFAGNASPTDLRLEMRVTVAAAENGVPAGTTLTFDYRVARDLPRAAADDGEEGGCRMVMRPIANFGGGMTMAQVPECD